MSGRKSARGTATRAPGCTPKAGKPSGPTSSKERFGSASSASEFSLIACVSAMSVLPTGTNKKLKGTGYTGDSPTTTDSLTRLRI